MNLITTLRRGGLRHGAIVAVLIIEIRDQSVPIPRTDAFSMAVTCRPETLTLLSSPHQITMSDFSQCEQPCEQAVHKIFSTKVFSRLWLNEEKNAERDEQTRPIAYSGPERAGAIMAWQSEFPMTVAVCAWCCPGDGAAPGAVSHGICLRHLRELKLQIHLQESGGGKAASTSHSRHTSGLEAFLFPLPLAV